MSVGELQYGPQFLKKNNNNNKARDFVYIGKESYKTLIPKNEPRETWKLKKRYCSSQFF